MGKNYRLIKRREIIKMTKKSMYLPAVFTVLLILSTAMMGSFDLTVQKWTALIGLIAILILTIAHKGKNIFKSYTTPLFVAIVGYVIWNGISIFYAEIPKAALFEFTKLIVASAVFLAILTFTTPTRKSFKRAATIMSITTAFFGIISIDAASNGPIATSFKAFMGLFTNSMQSFGVFESGIRITGIFGNANTFSGFMALGILLSLSLVINSVSNKDRTVSIIILAVNSLAYILLFSLGSIFMFFIACILMIITSNKEQKLPTFILMAETAIITLIFTGVSLISLGSSPTIPLVAIILNALVLWVIDKYVSQPVVSKLASNLKGSIVSGIIILLLIIGYIIAALNISGPLTLTVNETVMRGAYLDAGEYKLESVIDGQQVTSDNVNNSTLPTIRITTQNMNDLKVHTSTELFNGLLKDTVFTVPEDSEIVKIYFTGGTNGNTIEEVIYSSVDPNSEKIDLSSKNNVANRSQIKLNYKLLPAIAANRIQDLGANENSVQRLVFFQDGMKLFKQSPIIGKGLSGYETGVASVQNFYYETKYVHNHYIQTLCDLGIIGFAFFMGLFILCITSVIQMFRRSKAMSYKNADAFALPLMAACVFQMFGQAITDLTWSAGPFLLIAFGIMALLILVNSKDFVDGASENEELEALNSADSDENYSANGNPVITGGLVSRIGIISVTAIMFILLTLNLYAHYKADSGNCTMDQISTLTKMDKFEGDDYKTTYIVTATTYGLKENFEQANKFASELNRNPNVILDYLLPYYFNTGQDDKLFETASLAIQNGKADPDTWNQLFNIFRNAINTNQDNPMPVLLHIFENKEYYIGGLLGYYRELQERNANYLDNVILKPSNTAFISKLIGIENLDKSRIVEALDVFLKINFDSSYAIDVDNNHTPDNITILSGETVWGQAYNSNETEATSTATVTSNFDGSMIASENTTMVLNVYCVRGGEYTLRLHGLTGLNGTTVPKDLQISIDGQPLTMQYDGNGAFAKVKLKGSVPADEANNVTASTASEEKITISFPTGAEMTKVEIRK